MLLASLAAVPGARALDVKVPCGDAKSGLNECDEVKDRTVQLVSDRAKEIVEGWYRGEGGFAKRTCAVLPNVFNNGTPEIEQNHRQQDCGPSAQLDTRIQVIRKRFSVRVNSQTSVSYEGDHGTRERSYSGGAMVQAADCWLKKINKQIRAGTVSISACSSMGGRLGEDIQSLTASLGAAGSQVEGANIRQVVNKCDPKTQEEQKKRGKASEDQMVGAEALTMQYCRLNSERAGVEAMLQQLAVCELFAQAKKEYDRFELSSLDPGRLKSRLNGWAQACRNAGDKTGCYQQHYLDFVRGEIQRQFASCE